MGLRVIFGVNITLLEVGLQISADKPVVSNTQSQRQQPNLGFISFCILDHVIHQKWNDHTLLFRLFIVWLY